MFAPGPGAQLHDLQPGVAPNGLFWVAEIPKRGYWAGRNRARLRLRGQPLIDSFVFLQPGGVPATVDIDLTWQRSGPYAKRGSGKDVDPTHPAAFLGDFAEATCEGWVSGAELGFAFRTGRLDATGYYAQIGTEKNGAFLD